MLIAVEELAARPLRLEHSYAAGEIPSRVDAEARTAAAEDDGGLVLIGPLRARVEARLSGPQIRVRLEMTGRARTQCARCLEEVEAPIARSADLTYYPAGGPGGGLTGGGEVEIHAADADLGFYREPGIELEDLLREQVLLSLPMRTLCREDCRGLCPRCGRNLNAGACGCAASIPSAP